MGFFTGFMSGFALTTSALYITITIHRTNRLEQRRQIRDQVDQINWLTSSLGAYDRRNLPEETRRPLSERLTHQDEPVTIKGVLKHRWNTEVQKLARKAQESTWEDVRDASVEAWKRVSQYVKKE
ncbi:hypothetical protein N7532_000282 [Penicillium argentinense]|uniref:MICOS complex subunit MIC12 n=1 Tax=Penicillium argentinense TaxID=1131581 RepID=A0A9W9G6H3_9EURO|nr:uncharacterized protein N7532_000282 [Penicillium argentinense]KAJ5112237.1 hypothetical protein N7532_000282 [Penicillium argentinense]